ncbi:putative baseplate assembly protein [Longispora fulva]|uniref:Putative phage baseplate assembly protein n=1 Tax=Longispora fulva TaxID=619741 RepID=A0A8J7GQX8_9ACTN|nr:putative baseplate assembly protein [Longispora fulva]MBG6141713.1 putative phage baseplate assembly protein [Longispora fulva]GIG59132.1 putative baseplate assembly protein [Longispora fulva]
MSLPSPNLDDRRFQELVDEAKRMVQQRCPEWTDHNVSDPGVTLIETFAFMVDTVLYRMNRVPHLHYLKFLDLIGVRLFPPTAATGEVTYRLAAAQPETVVVPAGAQVASQRVDTEDPVVFTVERELRIVPCHLERVLTASGADVPADRSEELAAGTGLACFSAQPVPGDVVLFGLDVPVPHCLVLLRVDCDVAGVGVDPRDPPLVWEAWTGTGWERCVVDEDSTGGFNKPGDVLLHVPAHHDASVLGRHRAAWLRCRVLDPVAGQPFYRASPRLLSVAASTMGGSVAVVHAEVVRGEVAGMSTGVPGQRFPLEHRPVVADAEPLVLLVDADEWREVTSFAGSGATDRHFMVDRGAGELLFGPAVRGADGGLRHYGAVPGKGATIRIPVYRTGGGRRGNVARNMLQIQRDPVPFVSTVSNRVPASGGVDGESVEDASTRGPLTLRTRDRAVTAEDFEQLAREAAPDAARVRCVPVSEESGAVRVLVVPAVTATDDLRFADLKPSAALLSKVSRYLDERRCIGARISVEPPFYQGVTVVAELQARPRTEPEVLRARALQELYAYLHPITGGPDHTGWPFGRPVHSGDIFAVLQRVPGVELVEEVRLFGADPVTGARGGAVPRLPLSPNGLIFSYGHQVRVGRA